MTKSLPLIGALLLSLSTVPEGASAQANPQVLIKTSKGEIVVELYPAKAPASVENFLKYVDSKHYDGTVFHRVISNFMIQGGGFTPDMKKKPTNKPIANEWKNGLKNVRGSLAMARLGGDADSATCQFFINAVDNDFLDRPQPDGAAYAVFGMVTKGLDVLDKIRVVKTGSKAGHSDVPLSPVEITKIEVVG
jgi:peptidyl-prolyl cis-trans isomerase A (cyclophilin A)